MPQPRNHRPHVGTDPMPWSDRVALQQSLRTDRFVSYLEALGISPEAANAAARHAEALALDTPLSLDQALGAIEHFVARYGVLPPAVQEAA